MPRAPLHALIWSSGQGLYELFTQGQVVRRFLPGDEAAWLTWLGEVTSLAFHSPSGNLNVYQETRPRGGRYWYAYHTDRGGIRKRYLGRTAHVSLARLEETAHVLSMVQAPAPDSPSFVPASPENEPGRLLVTKLAPPRLPNVLVSRDHLLARLDGAFSTPLTLLSAPAGWGKTTLLATWASQHQALVVWLSLDELDKSPTRFWVALIAALRRCGSYAPDLGETAVALLQSPQPPPLVTCLSTLLHELEGQEASPPLLVLIVDDYQVIDDPAIHEGMSLFLEHLPAHLHLILSSRVDPDLPLARLRVRGQLTEIRAADLRFREGEASHFLSQLLSPPLSAEEVRLLTLRTEGWIAGLHLAALALQKREDRAAFLRAFTGSQRYLLDYVQEDILARLPTPVRDFLLRVAILSRLEASVCQAVTAWSSRAASQQMLAKLERANLFLVPLDEERRWYRLHELFREALMAALHTTHPELVPVLHIRAASFYEAQGQWSEAIAHRLAAADFSTAARLMEQTAEQFWLRGEAMTVARWVLELPEPLVREYARLALTTTLYLLNTDNQAPEVQRERRHQQVRQLMGRVETALRQESDKTNPPLSVPHTDTGAAFRTTEREARASEEAVLHRRLRLLHLFMAVNEAIARGEFERLSGMQQEMQELDRDEEVIWQMIPLAYSFFLQCGPQQEGALLVPRLLSARERASRSGSHFASIRVRQWLAVAALKAGKLRLAYEESQAALDLIEQIAGYALLKGYFEMVLVEVCYQWNRLEKARELLHMALHEAFAWQQLDVLGWAYADLMHVELARGAWSAAELALQKVEQLVEHERYGVYPSWLPAMRADFWLAQGRLGEASDWAAGVVFPEEPWDPGSSSAFPVVIRVYFAERRWTEALELLERWRGHLDRPANIESTIPYLSQLLVALHQAGKTEQAQRVAARLFALTEPEDYLRVYLDEGEPMRQALLALLTADSQHQSQAPSMTAYVSKLLAAFAEEERATGTSLEAARAPEPAPSLAPQASAASPALGASLTRREQEVLRLLAAGASNREIAQTLVISVATVKKHVSNLLSKLGAESRTQAIAQARALSLL
jgi:LuxR family maltose regulon positive regulatory protein